MSSADEYIQSWVNIERLELTNYKGQTEDIMKFFMKIDIQEDIFIPVCSGQITLMESVSFFEDFPIVGEETLSITYKDFFNESVTRTFSVFGVSAKEAATERASVYVLKFCSEELLYNRTEKYSKSYRNLLASDIFSDAFSRVNPTKEIYIQPTVELQDFVVPNLYPFEVCAAMASRAISAEGHEGSYVFFEDKEKFNFVSIEKLVTQTPIEYRIGSGGTYSHILPQNIIQTYKYHKPVNNIKNLMTGAQGVEAKTLDITKRNIEDKSYNHFESDDYTKIQRLNSSNPDLRQTTSKYKHQKNTGLYKVVIQNEEDNAKSSKNKVMAKRYNILSSFTNGPKIHAELPFNSKLTVGMVVSVDVPRPDSRDKSEDPDSEKYIKGKYIVMALRQIIQPDHAVTVVELAKDSYPENHEESEYAVNQYERPVE